MDRTYFDPETATRQRAANGRRSRWLALVLAVVAGGLAVGLHAETPFVASLLGYCEGVRFAVECEYPAWVYGLAALAGTGVGLVLAIPALLVAARRPVSPTVRCRSCDAVGWIDDLRARAGRCPLCAGHRFDYRAYGLGSVWLPGSVLFVPERVVENDAAGTDLIARYGEGRRSPRSRRDAAPPGGPAGG